MTDWRFIDSGPSEAFRNMALDEAIAASVRRGDCPPTLRLYGWSGPSLSIGCYQKSDGIDIEYLKEKNIALVRRPTGGRAILHGAELTYSFSAGLASPAEMGEGPFEGGLRESYGKIASALMAAFEKIGIRAEMEETRGREYSKTPLCFRSRSYGELSSGGRKLAGSAQRRWPDGFLQQGSIPYMSNEAELNRIFRLPGIGSESFVLIDPDCEQALKDAIRACFEDAFSVRLLPALPTPAEEELLQELLREKYLRGEWNLHGYPRGQE